jgi:thioredoxin-related protein
MSLGTNFLAAALFVAAPAFAADEPAATETSAWLQDFAAAKSKAATENKDLLIDFTGSDWCVWCQRLDKEVFAEGDFETKIQEQFVLVKLDFPRDKSLVSEEIQKQNQKLQGEYGVQGFPTIFLTDASGKPYAKTGYQRGGPENYLTHVAEKREVKTKFATGMAAVQPLAGAERAKALDAALAEIEADLWLPFYAAQVEEVLTLDHDGSVGVREKYEAAKLAYAETQAMNELNETFMPIFEAEDWAKLDPAVDGLVAKYKETMPQIAQQALMARVQACVMQKKFDDAIAAVTAAKEIDPDSEMSAQADMIIEQLKTMAKAPPAEEPGEDGGN